MDIFELDLPNNVANYIRRGFGITTVEELRKLLERMPSPEGLSKARGIGPTSIAKILVALQEPGTGKLSDKRSLYQCSCAKVRGRKIVCSAGHELSLHASLLALARGAPLELSCCQNCEDYDEMGPPVPAAERGWA